MSVGRVFLLYSFTSILHLFWGYEEWFQPFFQKFSSGGIFPLSRLEVFFLFVFLTLCLWLTWIDICFYLCFFFFVAAITIRRWKCKRIPVAIVSMYCSTSSPTPPNYTSPPCLCLSFFYFHWHGLTCSTVLWSELTHFVGFETVCCLSSLSGFRYLSLGWWGLFQSLSLLEFAVIHLDYIPFQCYFMADLYNCISGCV